MATFQEQQQRANTALASAAKRSAGPSGLPAVRKIIGGIAGKLQGQAPRPYPKRARGVRPRPPQRRGKY